tara:strand:- start:754 stop:1047 length:294 start_codon:yes stop_codon:yes gene_type:complete
MSGGSLNHFAISDIDGGLLGVVMFGAETLNTKMCIEIVVEIYVVAGVVSVKNREDTQGPTFLEETIHLLVELQELLRMRLPKIHEVVDGYTIVRMAW